MVHTAETNLAKRFKQWLFALTLLIIFPIKAASAELDYDPRQFCPPQTPKKTISDLDLTIKRVAFVTMTRKDIGISKIGVTMFNNSYERIEPDWLEEDRFLSRLQNIPGEDATVEAVDIGPLRDALREHISFRFGKEHIKLSKTAKPVLAEIVSRHNIDLIVIIFEPERAQDHLFVTSAYIPAKGIYWRGKSPPLAYAKLSLEAVDARTGKSLRRAPVSFSSYWRYPDLPHSNPFDASSETFTDQGGFDRLLTLELLNFNQLLYWLELRPVPVDVPEQVVSRLQHADGRLKKAVIGGVLGIPMSGNNGMPKPLCRR